MPVRDRQHLITDIVSTVLDEPLAPPSFRWMTNRHGEEHTGEPYASLQAMFFALKGDVEAHAEKRERPLICDAYFGGRYNFILEFDEIQHFSSYRLKTFEYYPEGLKVGYDLTAYRDYCRKYQAEAGRYRSSKTTTDFPFSGGRTAQRAYLDAVKDILPPYHDLNPTIRIAEFEVAQVQENDKKGQRIIRGILRNKLPLVLSANDLMEINI